MSGNPVQQFINELETKSFPINSARKVLAQLEERMGVKEKARVLTLIAQQESEVQKRLKPKISWLDIVPNGWLKDYLIYTQINEARDSLHFYSALAVLGNLIGRNIWFTLGVKKLFSPMSAFLLSPAGQGRRSTAINTAVAIGRAAGASVLKDRMTPEGLLDWLQLQQNTLVVADEAGTILNKTDYMQQMPQILCTLLDHPDEFSTKLKVGFVQIQQPTISCLIGCAPDWFETTLPKSAVGGGLLSRMLVVHEDGKKGSFPFPEDLVETSIAEGMKKKLVQDLATLTRQYTGEVKFEAAAKEQFIAFYNDNDRLLVGCHEKMAAYYSRKPDHVKRLCANLLVSSGKGLLVDMDTLERALAILTLTERGMKEAYRSAGLERPGQLQMKILKTIQAKGGEILWSVLLRSMAGQAASREVRDAVSYLIEAGWAEMGKEVGEGRLRQTVKLLKESFE